MSDTESYVLKNQILEGFSTFTVLPSFEINSLSFLNEAQLLDVMSQLFPIHFPKLKVHQNIKSCSTASALYFCPKNFLE